MAFFPDLVGTDENGEMIADAAETTPFRLKALSEGWVSITRPWHLLTTNSGAAPPQAASAEKGEQMMKLLVERLGGFLVELAAAELDDDFPFRRP